MAGAAGHAVNAGRHPIVGLTGNLASGKSTVAAMLLGLGARVIDSDAIVRRLLQEDAELKAEIRSTFGGAVFDGAEVSRARLAAIVFQDAVELARLERLVHPRVGHETARMLDEPTVAAATVLEAIKVVEGPNGARLDALWVLVTPEAALLRRAVASRGLSNAEAESRLAMQSSVADKVRAFAERQPNRPVWYIENDGSVEDLERRVQASWWGLLQHAGSAETGARGEAR